MKHIFLQCDLSRQLKYTSLKWIFVLREECMHHVKSFCKSALSRCKLFPECKNAQNVQSKIIWNFHWKLVYTLIRLFIIYCFALQICNIVSTIMQVNTNGALLLEALDLLIECIWSKKYFLHRKDWTDIYLISKELLKCLRENALLIWVSKLKHSNMK